MRTGLNNTIIEMMMGPEFIIGLTISLVMMIFVLPTAALSPCYLVKPVHCDLVDKWKSYTGYKSKCSKKVKEWAKSGKKLTMIDIRNIFTEECFWQMAPKETVELTDNYGRNACKLLGIKFGKEFENCSQFPRRLNRYRAYEYALSSLQLKYPLGNCTLKKIFDFMTTTKIAELFNSCPLNLLLYMKDEDIHDHIKNMLDVGSVSALCIAKMLEKFSMSNVRFHGNGSEIELQLQLLQPTCLGGTLNDTTWFGPEGKICNFLKTNDPEAVCTLKSFHDFLVFLAFEVEKRRQSESASAYFFYWFLAHILDQLKTTNDMNKFIKRFKHELKHKFLLQSQGQ